MVKAVNHVEVIRGVRRADLPKGRVGALEPHCSHRGTSLEWGRVEEEGLRCCYHGWLYDTQGQCIDMPCETEEFRRRMDVWHPAYPTTEYGGLVFVYMGPPGTEPLFPMYDITEAARTERKRAEGDITFEFVADSLLERDGFEPSVPG